MISILPVPSTPENTHGCCDGYGWDAVKKDCVGMSMALVTSKQITLTKFYFYFFIKLLKYLIIAYI